MTSNQTVTVFGAYGHSGTQTVMAEEYSARRRSGVC